MVTILQISTNIQHLNFHTNWLPDKQLYDLYDFVTYVT